MQFAELYDVFTPLAKEQLDPEDKIPRLTYVSVLELAGPLTGRAFIERCLYIAEKYPFLAALILDAAMLRLDSSVSEDLISKCQAQLECALEQSYKRTGISLVPVHPEIQKDIIQRRYESQCQSAQMLYNHAVQQLSKTKICTALIRQAILHALQGRYSNGLALLAQTRDFGQANLVPSVYLLHSCFAMGILLHKESGVTPFRDPEELAVHLAITAQAARKLSFQAHFIERTSPQCCAFTGLAHLFLGSYRSALAFLFFSVRDIALIVRELYDSMTSFISEWMASLCNTDHESLFLLALDQDEWAFDQETLDNAGVTASDDQLKDLFRDNDPVLLKGDYWDCINLIHTRLSTVTHIGEVFLLFIVLALDFLPIESFIFMDFDIDSIERIAASSTTKLLQGAKAKTQMDHDKLLVEDEQYDKELLLDSMSALSRQGNHKQDGLVCEDLDIRYDELTPHGSLILELFYRRTISAQRLPSYETAISIHDLITANEFGEAIDLLDGPAREYIELIPWAAPHIDFLIPTAIEKVSSYAASN